MSDRLKLLNRDIQIGMRHRPCCLVGVGAALLSLSLTGVRERSAGTAQITTGHLTKAPACRVTGTRASRRSTAAIFYTASALLGLDRRLASHVIRAALALPFIQTRPAIEGSPLIGCGR